MKLCKKNPCLTDICIIHLCYLWIFQKHVNLFLCSAEDRVEAAWKGLYKLLRG